MRTIRKVMPVLLAAAALAGCRNVGYVPSAGGVCENSCDQLADCDGDAFEDEYSSTAQCEIQCAENLDDFLEGYPDCEDVYLHYEDCLATMSCEELLGEGSADCFALGDDLDECVDENYEPDDDNVEACQELQDFLNNLDCLEGTDVDLVCDDFTEYDCDISDYFDCLTLCYGCDGDELTFDDATYENDCMPMSECD